MITNISEITRGVECEELIAYLQTLRRTLVDKERKEQGIELSVGGRPKVDVSSEQIASLRANGKSWEAIAKALSISVATAYNRLSAEQRECLPKRVKRKYGKKKGAR